MSAPFNGTKTRVVGFFKGLFGKQDSGNQESVHDDVKYDYYQTSPVTGAQLKSPAPVAPPANSAAVSQPKLVASPTPNRTGGGPGSPLRTSNPTGAAVAPAVSARLNTAAVAVSHSPGAPAAPIRVPTPIAANPAGTIALKPGVAAPTPKPATVPVAMPSTAGKFVSLSVGAVAATLPAELKARVIRKDLDAHSVALPEAQILAQLPTGVVKVAFGCIREGAPQCFSPADDADHLLVVLPLAEILKRLHPTQLAKPQNQVRLTAEDDVVSPFAEKGNDERFEVKPAAVPRVVAAPTATPSVAPRPQAVDRPKPEATPTPPAPVRINLTPSAPAPQAPPAPVELATPIKLPAIAPLTAKAAEPKPAVAPTPPPAPAATAPFALPAKQINGAPTLKLAGTPAETPTPNPVPPAPAAKPTSSPAAKPVTATPAVAKLPSLTVALEKLMDNWPDAVKQEIAAQGLPTAKVDLPTEAIGEQLKSGRVAFEWHSLRGWLTPAPVEASSVENIVLDLPLKVVAPLFFGSKGTENKTQRLTADANIPDVFAQAGKPSHPPAPVAPAPPVPTPVNPPVDMSPEGIVTRAAALKGVAGAFIALPDGLLVASRLPRAANGESLAAFLPQVCAKFDASLTALGMGTLNDLSFRAGKVPWRVFRTSKVFFAVFGGEQAPLPVEGLTVLAGELEKH